MAVHKTRTYIDPGQAGWQGPTSMLLCEEGRAPQADSDLLETATHVSTYATLPPWMGKALSACPAPNTQGFGKNYLVLFRSSVLPRKAGGRDAIRTCTLWSIHPALCCKDSGCHKCAEDCLPPSVRADSWAMF